MITITAKLKQFIHNKPTQVAHRILSEFGDDTESIIKKFLEDGTLRDELLYKVASQRKKREIRYWNKGIVKTY